MPDKNLYLIAGCNGAGKTTASFTLLPDVLDCREFANADEIAHGLSPFQPEKVAVEAGRIMLHRPPIYTRRKIKAAQQQGYPTTPLYFWLSSPELAQKLVKTKVLEGSHLHCARGN